MTSDRALRARQDGGPENHAKVIILNSPKADDTNFIAENFELMIVYLSNTDFLKIVRVAKSNETVNTDTLHTPRNAETESETSWRVTKRRRKS